MDERTRERTASLACTVLFILAALYAAAAVALAIVATPLEGLLFALLTCVPAAAIASMRRSHRHPGATRLAALAFATLCLLVIAGNWSGYDDRTRVLIPLLGGPLVVACLAVFLTTNPRTARSPTVQH